MSLATRCTQCGTIFRVVQDQLKVSEGWVRCGRCSEVFNALEGLFDLDRDPPPQRAPVAAHPGSDQAAPSVEEPAPEAAPKSSAPLGAMEFVASREGDNGPDPAAWVPQTHEEDALESRFLVKRDSSVRAAQRRDQPDFEDARFPEGMATDDSQHPADEADSAVVHARRKPLVERWRDSRRMRAQNRIERQERRDREAREARSQKDERAERGQRDLRDIRAVEDDVAPDEAVDSSDLPQDVGFIREAERAARMNRPAVRVALVLAGMALAAVLAAQVGLQFRDSLASLYPQTRPALMALCDFAGCHIEPPRRIDDWVIESSGLSKASAADAYRLSLTLRNRGPVALAVPSVDLSVSDPSGELIARRALSPADLRASSPVVAAGGESNVQVVLTAGSRRIAGYTVEVFYP